ncbi:Bro-N domain-containing protein, partial [Enterococcus gallinarum]
METPQIFSFEDNQVRTILVNDEPYFVGKDVAEILGYKNTSKALKDHVDNEDKRGERIVTPSGEQVATIINESGLYSLILKSKLLNARKFKRWV